MFWFFSAVKNGPFKQNKSNKNYLQFLNIISQPVFKTVTLPHNHIFDSKLRSHCKRANYDSKLHILLTSTGSVIPRVINPYFNNT